MRRKKSLRYKVSEQLLSPSLVLSSTCLAASRRLPLCMFHVRAGTPPRPNEEMLQSICSVYHLPARICLLIAIEDNYIVIFIKFLSNSSSISQDHVGNPCRLLTWCYCGTTVGCLLLCFLVMF